MKTQQDLDKHFKIVFWICIIIYSIANFAVFTITYGGNKWHYLYCFYGVLDLDIYLAKRLIINGGNKWNHKI